jgi:hypothetical protein
MAHRIDHTGHPHPSTPAARALCRANGGTGSTAKRGENAPTSKRAIATPPLTEPKVPVARPATQNKTTSTTVRAAAKSGIGKKLEQTDADRQKTVDRKKEQEERLKRIAERNKTTTAAPPPPPVKASGPLTSFIPAATTKEMQLSRAKGKIQNALRRGASREFIVAQSTSMSPEVANQTIDDLLRRYGVPAHVYPRKGSGGATPDARTVKTTPIDKVNKANPPASVTPNTGEDSAILTAVKKRVNVNPKVQAVTDSALRRQEDRVGSKIARIRSVSSGITPRKYNISLTAGTLGICQGGHIELHSDLHNHEDEMKRNRAAGWFVKGGGTGVEQVITHEMAHALLTEGTMTAFQRGQFKDALVTHLGLTDTIGTRTAYQGDLDRMIKQADNQRIIKRKVGKYAAAHINELIAEVWTDYTMNPAPSAGTKGVGSVLERIIVQGG